MPLSLADYLAYVRSQALPGYATPSSVANDPNFNTRSSLTTEPGGDSSTGTGSLAGRGDTSLGGRLALNADLNVNNVSVAKSALGLVGLLSGPLGGLASKAAIVGVNAHNQSEINTALGKAGFKVGEAPPEIVADAINEAINAHNPQGLGMGLPGFPGHPAFGHQGFNFSDFSLRGFTPQARADDPPPSPPPPDETAPPQGPPPDSPPPDAPPSDAPAPSDGPGPAGPAGPSGATGDGPYHLGGVVQDRQPGLNENITAAEGEYVVRTERAAKFRPLLEAINQGSEQQVKRALKAALTG